MLKKKTAVLTGSNRGIGKEILKSLAENNANIIACSRNSDEKHISFIQDLKKKNKVEIDTYFFRSFEFRSC